MEAGLKRPAVVIRHDSKSFAEQTEHRSRIHARRVAVAAGLGLEATARRLARNYELAYGRPIAVPRRAGRVALPAGRPGSRRLPAGRVGRPGGRVPARRRAASRGARGSPGRSRSGDPDLPPEPLAVVARPGRAATRCPCFGLGFPHRRREHARRHSAAGCPPAGASPGLWGEETWVVHRPGGCRVLVPPRCLCPGSAPAGGDAMSRRTFVTWDSGGVGGRGVVCPHPGRPPRGVGRDAGASRPAGPRLLPAQVGGLLTRPSGSFQ